MLWIGMNGFYGTRSLLGLKFFRLITESRSLHKSGRLE